MIKFCSGTIFNSKCEAFINPVNCVGVSGKGLALEFKIRYPDMFLSYKQLCSEGILQLGKVAMWRNSHNHPKYVCLFPTKFHWKEKSDVRSIELGLKAFLVAAEKAELSSAAFPKIGCGLGGLDFEHEVRPLMEHYLKNSSLDIELYL